MKFRTLTILTAALFVAFSCDGLNLDADKDKEQEEEAGGNGKDNGNGNEGGNGETALSPDEQKAFLESVGKEIIALGDVDNWKNIVSSIHAFAKTIEGTDASLLDEVLLEAGVFKDKSYSESAITTSKGSPLNGSVWYNTSRDYDDRYENTLQLSLIKGHFSLGSDKKWHKETAQDFTLSHTVDGKPVQIALRVEDYDQEILIYEYEHSYKYGAAQRMGGAYCTYERFWSEYGSYFIVYNPITDEEYGKYYWDVREYIDHAMALYEQAHPGNQDGDWWEAYELYRQNLENELNRQQGAYLAIRIPYPEYLCTEYHLSRTKFYMPKRITGSYSENGNKLVDILCEIDYQCADGKKFDPAADNLNLTTTLSAGDYKLQIVKLKYLTDEAEVELRVSKGNTTVLTIKAEEKGHGLQRYTYDETCDSSYQTPDANGNNYLYTNVSRNRGDTLDESITSLPEEASVSVDILGKIQIKVSSNQIRAIREKIDVLSENRYNQNGFLAALRDLEKTFDNQVFFDGGSAEQARLGLEPSSYTETWNENKQAWEVIPVIRFADGSAYALASEFFSESNFPEVVTTAKDWWKKVIDYLEEVGIIDRSKPVEGDGGQHLE